MSVYTYYEYEKPVGKRVVTSQFSDYGIGLVGIGTERDQNGRPNVSGDVAYVVSLTSQHLPLNDQTSMPDYTARMSTWWNKKSSEEKATHVRNLYSVNDLSSFKQRYSELSWDELLTRMRNNEESVNTHQGPYTKWHSTIIAGTVSMTDAPRLQT
jgi:hypothetical protein